MATLRELKGRIGSVASSEKITGAMKMISSAKMHKAEQSLKRLLPYRNQIEAIISNLLSSDAVFSSPLIEPKSVSDVAIVVLGSDDGLCGAYNVNIFKELVVRIDSLRKEYDHPVSVTLIPVGSKMTKACLKIAGGDVKVVTVEGVDSKSSGDVVKSFVDGLKHDFLNNVYQRVDVLYMSFKSVSRQRLAYQTLFPVIPETFSELGAASEAEKPYIFEPDANTIFSVVLPMYLLSLMQEIFTENRASEQAARVMAMQSANDNAVKLLEQLQLEYNKLRQQSITTELLDILGGQIR